MVKRVGIPVGLGKVFLDNTLEEFAGKGNYIVMRLESREGPCNDVDCQRFLSAVVEITQLPDDSLKLFAGDGYFLALEQPIFAAIDKGRQTVVVKKTRLGKLMVKDLVL